MSHKQGYILKRHSDIVKAYTDGTKELIDSSLEVGLLPCKYAFGYTTYIAR